MMIWYSSDDSLCFTGAIGDLDRVGPERVRRFLRCLDFGIVFMVAGGWVTGLWRRVVIR